KDVKDPTTFRDPNPVGTGPFVLGNYTDQQYSMDKNPKYWQADKIAIKHLILPATNTMVGTTFLKPFEAPRAVAHTASRT
ncbi:hypothetical protein IAE22_35485, partial [Bacillus sp. S34]|nr:hypothetical protein [Bacillus sp. S34]